MSGGKERNDKLRGKQERFLKHMNNEDTSN